MSICSGPELGVSPDGSLRVRGTRPSPWPVAAAPCAPSAVGDLRKDAVSGLWVPPAQVALYQQRIDTGQVQIPVGFGAWYLNAADVASTALPPQGCGQNQQLLVYSTFVINATLAQNTALTWVLHSGQSPDPTSLPPSSVFLEHGEFKCWPDGGVAASTLYPMARTDTLVRRIGYVPHSVPTPLYQWQAVSAYQFGSGNAVPVITRLVVETQVFSFATDHGVLSSPGI